MDQELLDNIREIVCEETKKIVREETRKIVHEETRKIVREETADMRKDVSGLKTDVSSLKTDVSSLKTDVSSLKKQVNENTLILRSLEENNKIRNAQMDRMENDIAKLLGKYKKVDELEDRFIHHTHTIVIETSKPEERAS